MKYKAMVRFLNAEEGGRNRPPLSGYKPHLKIGKEHTSCWIFSVNPQNYIMDFGIEHMVQLELQFEDKYPNKSFLKEEIELFEGKKRVGLGRFLQQV